jgi:hypothetical protein
MFTGQILVYRLNGIHNVIQGMDRNIYALKNISVETTAEFKQIIEDALDEVPAGKGYALVKWSNNLFVCEKDINNPKIGYIRTEINYHPLMHLFTI